MKKPQQPKNKQDWITNRQGVSYYANKNLSTQTNSFLDIKTPSSSGGYETLHNNFVSWNEGKTSIKFNDNRSLYDVLNKWCNDSNVIFQMFYDDKTNAKDKHTIHLYPSPLNFFDEVTNIDILCKKEASHADQKWHIYISVIALQLVTGKIDDKWIWSNPATYWDEKFLFNLNGKKSEPLYYTPMLIWIVENTDINPSGQHELAKWIERLSDESQSIDLNLEKFEKWLWDEYVNIMSVQLPSYFNQQELYLSSLTSFLN